MDPPEERPTLDPGVNGPRVGALGAVFGFYLLALALVVRLGAAFRGALGLILGFALVFRILLLWTPVYLSSDPYRYLWDGRVQWAGVSPYRHPNRSPSW